MCSKAAARAAMERVSEAASQLIDLCAGHACQVHRLLGDPEPAYRIMPDKEIDALTEKLKRID